MSIASTLEPSEGSLMDMNSTEDPFMMSDWENMTQYAGKIFSVSNCTELFENVTVAREHNITCLEHAPTLSNQKLIRAVVLALMSIFSLLANVAAILAIRRDKNRTSLCTMILHLSVADIVVSLFCMLGEGIWTYTVGWYGGQVACKMVKYCQCFGLYLSTYLVVVIGLDRWKAIAQPLKRSQCGHRASRRYFTGCYALSLVFSVPQLFIFSVQRGPFYEDFHQCVTYGFYTHHWQEVVYSTFNSFTMFIGPLGVLVITYSAALIRLRASERSFNASELTSRMSHSESHRQRRMRKATKRSLQMSLCIVGGFLLCWIPYYGVNAVILFGVAPDNFSRTLVDGIFFFGMSNALINPLIYGAFHLWRPSGLKGAPQGTSSYELKSLRVTVGGRASRCNKSPLGAKSSFLLTTTDRELSTCTTSQCFSNTPTVSQAAGAGFGDYPSGSCSNGPKPGPGSGPGSGCGGFSSSVRRSRPPGVMRCNTADFNGTSSGGAGGASNGGGGGGATTPSLALGRCATFDCTSANVDRKKVSLKRREIKGHLYEDRKNGGITVPTIDYTKEILEDDDF